MNTKNTRIKLKHIECNELNLGQRRSSGVRVMTPKNTYFKIIPHSHIDAAVIYHNGHWYLFDLELAGYYVGKLKKISKATLYQGITETGENFILPVVEPWSGYTDSWYISLQDIAQKAQNKYIKIDSNINQNCYEIIHSKRIIGTTNTPSDLENLIDKAFPEDYYVDYDAHPLIDELYIG